MFVTTDALTRDRVHGQTISPTTEQALAARILDRK